MQLTFCGAVRNVTGSCYHLQTDGTQFLVDCGMYQERSLQERNWDPFPFDPAALDCVLLTHAHVDHIGRLPLLVRHGFRGRVLGTRATADLVELLLLDSAHIQEEDARFKTKRHRREGRELGPTQPLYTTDDAEAVLELVEAVEYRRPVELAPGLTVTWNDAGHMLGSAHVAIDTEGRRTGFSGDIGAKGRVILKDPEPFERADTVICESTYGDRLHETLEFSVDTLREAIVDTLKRGGNVVIPSFAVGRTQTLLYYMRKLMESKQIPPVTTFVDSPMAVEATQIMRRHKECFDEEAQALVAAGKDPVGFEPLHFCSSTASSKAINRVRGCVIISASGMCTNGRIKHHLLHNIDRPESTILFPGFQAEHTLGRIIVEGAQEVRILGEQKRVRARVMSFDGLSGHADRDGLLDWLGALQAPPKQVYVSHGEAEVAEKFAGRITDTFGWPARAPEYRETVAV